MGTEYRTLKSQKEVHETEKELTEKGYKRTFNSANSQIWEKGKYAKHHRIVLEFEF